MNLENVAFNEVNQTQGHKEHTLSYLTGESITVYNMLEKLLEGEDGEMLVRGRKLQRRVGFNLLLHNRVIVVNSNVSPISK